MTAFVSPSYRAWQDALSDPATRAALDQGLADVGAGRTRPWVADMTEEDPDPGDVLPDDENDPVPEPEEE